MTADTGRWEGIDRRTHAALGDSTLRATYLSGVATGHEEAAEAIVARLERVWNDMPHDFRTGVLAAAEVARHG